MVPVLPQRHQVPHLVLTGVWSGAWLQVASANTLIPLGCSPILGWVAWRQWAFLCATPYWLLFEGPRAMPATRLQQPTCRTACRVVCAQLVNGHADASQDLD